MKLTVSQKKTTPISKDLIGVFLRILIMVQMAAFMQSLLKTVTSSLQIATVIRVIIIQFLTGIWLEGIPGRGQRTSFSCLWKSCF